MIDSLFDHLDGIVSVILCIWSAVLVWGTWQLRALAKELDAQERELRRWKRLEGLAKRSKWPDDYYR